MHKEFAPHQPISHITIHGDSGLCGGLHGRVKETHGIPSSSLCLVHAHIGLFDQILRICMVLHVDDDPHAGCDAVRLLSECKGLGYFFLDFERHHFSLRRRLWLDGTECLQKDYKFITPKSRNTVTFAYTGADPVCRLPKKLISNFMSQSVIEQLEVVQVQQHQGRMLTRTKRVQCGLPDPVHHESTIGKRSELIVKGQASNFLFVLLLLSCVTHQAHKRRFTETLYSRDA